MASIKGASRSATVAFSPDAPYLAAGTMAGAVDLSFSSSASIEIFELDFASDDRELPVVGESTTSERFNRLSWGKGPAGSEEFALGLVAGSMVDGNIGIWNPNSLIRGTGNALVSQLTRHKGPVRGMEFNALSPNHLASGADEGDICIWDIAKPAEPTHFPPLKGSGSAAQGEISFLSWNSKVQHILASCSYSGTTVVWDLKKQKPVISFADSNRRRCSVLQWHPDMVTQLIVASDDDNSPSLKLWDMRNVMTPVKEFVGHTKGVIAMSWCPIDSSFLLTCAKDNRTICWDIASGEIVSELPAGTNWNFDVHWYPKSPGVISASSFDGKIGIYNVEGCGRFGVGEGDFGAAPLRAPKWYKRKTGVSFGFGGKLISFSSKDVPAGASEVYVHNLVTDHSLVSHSSEFEAAVRNGERSSLRLLCEKKSQESESEDDRETWGFLKVMFEVDGTARTKLLTHLGFSLPGVDKAAVEDDLSQEQSSAVLEENVVVDKVGSGPVVETTFLSDNGEDFFNNLSTPKAETPVSDSMDKFSIEQSVPLADETQQMDEQERSTDQSFIDSVQRALVVGDYKEAVELCLTANKMADALVIAHIGGPPLWERTLNRYLKTSHTPYLKTVSATINKDLTGLVNTRPLKSWKETLAMICTFAQGEEWAPLCDTLASKLMSAGNTLAATLCYICAGNIDKTVEIWSRSLSSENARKSYVQLLQDLMEKTIVFALASGQKQFSASLCKLVEKYAEMLASLGLLTTAMEYLKLMGTNELSPELTILCDRISQSIEVEKEAPLSTGFENSQLQGGPPYGVNQQAYGAVDASQIYSQETIPAQLQQSMPTSGYGESYQQSFDSYGRGGYSAPSQFQPAPQHPPSFQPTPQHPPSSFQPTPQHTPSFQPTPQHPASFQPTPPHPLPSFQPTPQPNMFIPSQTPQVPQQRNFGPPPVATQPSVKGFTPTTPPALRNVEQYQQQPTLGSHLYSGTGNPTHEVGPPSNGSLGPVPSQAGFAPGPKMPQVLAPTPGSRGFMSMPNAGVQRPGMGPSQPSTPTQAPQVQQPVATPAPPPTLQTADTTNVPAQQRPVVTTLTRLFNETSEALGGSRANPARKREIEDNSKKIGALFTKLNSGDISRNAAEKLVAICQALDNGDYATALQIQVQLTTSDWDECNFWLATLKRMIKTRQNAR